MSGVIYEWCTSHIDLIVFPLKHEGNKQQRNTNDICKPVPRKKIITPKIVRVFFFSPIFLMKTTYSRWKNRTTFIQWIQLKRTMISIIIMIIIIAWSEYYPAVTLVLFIYFILSIVCQSGRRFLNSSVYDIIPAIWFKFVRGLARKTIWYVQTIPVSSVFWP